MRNILTTPKVTKVAKTAVNYTDAMVAILRAAAPVDYDKAQALSVELGRGARSIIAKCKRENIEYISKPAPAKKKAAPSKNDLVAAISGKVGRLPIEGLEKATGMALAELLASLK